MLGAPADIYMLRAVWVAAAISKFCRPHQEAAAYVLYGPWSSWASDWLMIINVELSTNDKALKAQLLFPQLPKCTFRQHGLVCSPCS